MAVLKVSNCDTGKTLDGIAYLPEYITQSAAVLTSPERMLPMQSGQSQEMVGRIIETPEKQAQATDEKQPNNSKRLNEGSLGPSDCETELKNRLRFEKMISDLSARFIHVLPERLDDEIAYALQKVLEFFEVDRCGCFTFCLIKRHGKSAMWLIRNILRRYPEVPNCPNRITHGHTKNWR
jgi:hypothetical protein